MIVKMIVTVPFVIISSLCSVYCQPEEFPSRYPLEVCKSNRANLQLYEPGSDYEIARTELSPRKYCLIQTFWNNTRRYCFRKGDLEFLSMDDAELAMIIYSYDDQNVTWDVTCKFSSFAQARTFYRDMKHEQPSEKVRLLTADYLIKSDHIELGTGAELILSAHSFLDYITVTVTNGGNENGDDPVFIFPTDAVTQITQSGPTEISLYVRLNPRAEVFFKFGFSSESQTSLCGEILQKLCQHTDAELAPGNHQWLGDPAYQRLFNRIEELLEHQINNTEARLAASRRV